MIRVVQKKFNFLFYFEFLFFFTEIITMSELQFVNVGIASIHEELVRLMSVIVELMNIELRTESELHDLHKAIRNFETCKNQLAILREMLLWKVMNDELLNDGQN